VPIEVTQEAVEILHRSLELGNIDPASGGVRLRAAHGLGGGLDIHRPRRNRGDPGCSRGGRAAARNDRRPPRGLIL
jgi:hypothetical protein